MDYSFNEIKTTQAASILLSLNNNKMNYMKLIKLLYLIDRKAVLEWGFPLTFDRYVSMDHGPVLSMTYNLIIEGVREKGESYWCNHITAPSNYNVKLIKPAENGELSEAEINLIHEVYAEHKNKDQWEMVDFVHKLPEWVDPKGSSIPIEYEHIFKKSNKTQNEVKQIILEIKTMHLTSLLLNRHA